MIIINSCHNNKFIMKIKSDLVIVCCGLTLFSDFEKKIRKKNHKGFEPLIKIMRTWFGFWRKPKMEGMKKNSSEESKKNNGRKLKQKWMWSSRQKSVIVDALKSEQAKKDKIRNVRLRRFEVVVVIFLNLWAHRLY